MAVEENFLEHVPLSCLSANTIKELGVLLDPAVLESDVRCLADLLDYDYTHVRNLEDRNDRTKYFFDSWWCLRPDFTVLKLKECLEIMEREDIIADIWPKIVNDAQDWKRHEQERPIPDDSTEMAGDSWKLTIHDTDPRQPARYNACLCYEEDDIETAERFENELRNIHADLNFFIPHLHVMPGKYIYDCVAQVIDERCNKKVVIILPKKEFTDATCDFALQYARALDPSAKQGNLIPVIGSKDIHTPRVLLGVSGIRMFMKNNPLLWRAITVKLGVRISSQSSDSSLDTESSQLPSLPSISLKTSTSSSDTHESDEGLVADINSKLFSVALQDIVTAETPRNKVEEVNCTTSKEHEKSGANIVGEKKKKDSALVRFVSNVRRRIHRKPKKRTSLDNVTKAPKHTASEGSEYGTCASDSESDNGHVGVENEDSSYCNSYDD